MYKHHRFPLEIIQYAEWLYHRFGLSHRDVEDLLAEQLTCQNRFKCFTQL
jgi:putative transposase